jgi:acetolactate synthase-1/2/3 large subunit
MNGLCGCFYDSVPALFISGQVNMKESLDGITARPRQVGFQETPVVDCFRPFTKYAAKITDVRDVNRHLQVALQLMTSGRPGPSLLDYPVNVQMSDVEDIGGAPIEPCPADKHPHFSDKDAMHLLHKLTTSSRPVLLLGSGAREEAAFLADFVSKTAIPTVASWGGADIVPASQHYLGTIGVYGSRVANFAVQNADLLLVLGSRLDTRQTGGNLGKFSVQSYKIMVDVDPNEAAKLDERGVTVELKLCARVSSFVCNFLQPRLRDITKAVQAAPWVATLATWHGKYGEECRPTHDGFLSPYDLLKVVDDALPDSVVVAVDTGATLVWAFQTLTPRGPQRRLFSNLGNSSMGFALPAAIGAAIAKGDDTPIICIIGDGGFQQNIQELVTARQLGLNIKVLVFNNSGYGIIKQFQNSYLGGRHAASSSQDIYGPLATVDFVSVARAYGVKATKVQALTDFDAKSLRTVGLEVFDIIVHPDHGIQPKLEFGNSLENMSPFVDSAGDMLVPPPARLQASGWVKL